MAVRARECGCPPWVVPCVHFDGYVLWLTDEELAHASLAAHGNGGFNVVGGREEDLTNCDCGDPHKIFRVVDAEHSLGLTLDAARDEFRRRESELLGREG